jgi:hypothetical protein
MSSQVALHHSSVKDTAMHPGYNAALPHGWKLHADNLPKQSASEYFLHKIFRSIFFTWEKSWFLRPGRMLS